MKPDLLDHRKFLRLVRLLGEPKPLVVGLLMFMWRRGYQTGNPLLGDELDVEAAAEYTGEPGKFARAAKDAGFIDLRGDGRFEIHDLFEHAPEWAKKRMARHGYLPPGVTSYRGIVPNVGVRRKPNLAPSDGDGHDEEPPNGGQAAPDRPPKGQQTEGWGDFWGAYPRKVAKAAAERVFAKIAPPPELLAVMLAAIARQRTCDQWTKEDGRFIPHPATWLNQRRWEDEAPTATAPPAPRPAVDRETLAEKLRQAAERNQPKPAEAAS